MNRFIPDRQQPGSMLALIFAAALAGCQPDGDGPPDANHADTPEAAAAVLEFERGDLATAGLGIEGLRDAPPTPADPENPTATELYRLAVYNNYRALVDVSAGGGFGELYGPATDDLPIPGTEYWTLRQVPGGGSHVVILQVPDGFPGERPCLVAAPASGSRGPLGAIGSTADWALRHGCAVVHTDKGAGPWVAGLDDGRVFSITGVRDALENIDVAEPFSTRQWADLAGVAFKHAHSGHNPEAAWGDMVLDSIRFARSQLGRTHPVAEGDGLIVIAASVSNGGSAVLAAAEKDAEGLIDGVVASEPNVYAPAPRPVRLEEWGDVSVLDARPLYDYATLAAVHGPCAALGERIQGAPMAGNLALLRGLLAGRCRALGELGLTEGGDTSERANSAYARLLDHGLHPEAADAQAANTLINIWAIVGAVYADAYGRFDPGAGTCGIGFRVFGPDNKPAAMDPARAAQLFATSPGVPPVAGIDLAAVDRAEVIKLIFANSAATGEPAYGLDQVRCLRELWTGGADDGRRVRGGVSETALSGDLGGRPGIVLHGRSDGLIWVNHSSRPYVAANRAVEGEASNLSYIEVTNAQHFDTLLGIPDMAARFVPLHLYFERALDRMLAHLAGGAALPPSQVVVTRPRDMSEDGPNPLGSDNVPPMAGAGEARLIEWQDDTLRIPE